jgi:hypothetical protein
MSIANRTTQSAFVVLTALTLGTLGAASSAQAQYGPYTCVVGLVWREAVPYDYVCVSPQWRDKTWQENALGPSRRQPGGGPYGPDTCKQGFVWRETRPSDHVCVPPLSRDQNRRPNRTAYTGYAHPDQLPANGTQTWWTGYPSGGQLWVRPTHLPFYSWEPGRGYHGALGSYGVVYSEKAVTPRGCRMSNDRSMYVLAVDEVTGVVSNAGRVAVPLCLYP